LKVTDAREFDSQAFAAKINQIAHEFSKNLPRGRGFYPGPPWRDRKGMERKEKGKEGRGRKERERYINLRANFVKLEHWMHWKRSQALIKSTYAAITESTVNF
jgi:hypothetical protein